MAFLADVTLESWRMKTKPAIRTNSEAMNVSAQSYPQMRSRVEGCQWRFSKRGLIDERAVGRARLLRGRGLGLGCVTIALTLCLTAPAHLS